MGSKLLLGILWFVGTAVAATVAWQSLGLVSASTESAGLGIAPFGTTPSTSQPVTTVATGSKPSTADVGSPTTVDQTASTTSTEPGPTSGVGGGDSSAVDSAAIEQIFNLDGGSTAVSSSPTEIIVLWATAAPGYTATIEDEDLGKKVEFRSGDRRSRIELWWDDGPRHDIRER